MKLCLNEDDCISVSSGDQTTAGGGTCIVQEYVDKPLLISGYKSHIRLYVLITSAVPLRVFIYQDALLHLATEKYVTPAEGNLVYNGFFRFVSRPLMLQCCVRRRPSSVCDVMYCG